jgi:hypothetical protein
MGKDSLTITDNRTGKTYEAPIFYGTYANYGAAIPASVLREIKVDEDDFGLLAYDPGYGNTAACKSEITFIDGERGILRYRGYPIDQLAENCTYMEVAYMLLQGELPSQDELDVWCNTIRERQALHESVKLFLDGLMRIRWGCWLVLWVHFRLFIRMRAISKTRMFWICTFVAWWAKWQRLQLLVIGTVAGCPMSIPTQI